MRLYGVHAEPLIMDDGDEPGFLTDGRAILTFGTREEAEREMQMIEYDAPRCYLSVREITGGAA